MSDTQLKTHGEYPRRFRLAHLKLAFCDNPVQQHKCFVVTIRISPENRVWQMPYRPLEARMVSVGRIWGQDRTRESAMQLDHAL